MTRALLATLAAMLAAAWYVIACWIWPFASCRRCDGVGRFKSPSGKAWRYCRRCKGSATRLRLGRRFANWVSGTAGDAR